MLLFIVIVFLSCPGLQKMLKFGQDLKLEKGTFPCDQQSCGPDNKGERAPITFIFTLGSRGRGSHRNCVMEHQNQVSDHLVLLAQCT